jgi:hypothetical protein
MAWAGNRRDKAKMAVWVKIREYFFEQDGTEKNGQLELRGL